MPKQTDPYVAELTQQRDEARARAKKYASMADEQETADAKNALPASPSIARWRDKAHRYGLQADQKDAELAALKEPAE